VPDLSQLYSPTVLLAVLVSVILLIAVAVSVVAPLARRRRDSANLGAIAFVRTSFASQLSRGAPLDTLLLEMVEALRDGFSLDATELWLCEGGSLRLAAAEPPTQRDLILITPAEESIAANARVSSAAWARIWLPGLVEGRPEATLRVAPISHSGQLFGLIVAERESRGESLGVEADVTLEEVAREVGVALNKARLDSSLQASLEQLRIQAAELQASRGRLVAAADSERRRIERNLHDGAQQHLVALSTKVRLIEQLAERDPARARALQGQLQADAGAALEELRVLAHGIYPPLLSSGGLREALAGACRKAALPSVVEAEGIERYQPEVEAAVYFSCVEALQNAAKYAGPGASARVRLWEEAGGLLFEVADDGGGFDSSARDGAGLTNMRDRLGAVGGTLRVESAPGQGTRVHGAVPLGDPRPEV
jgi:signal transduction histidine kinase